VLEWWNRYWFPTSSTLNLACCRIIAVAAQLFWLFPSMDDQLNLLTRNADFQYPQIMIRAISHLVPRDVLFTPAGFGVIYKVTVIAGVLALIGLFTRTSLFVFALGTWFFVSHRYSYADVHHPEALFAIFLKTLPFSPAGDRLSVDALLRRWRARRRGKPADTAGVSDLAMWPLKLAHVLLAMTYFSTGITKVLAGGLDWMNGYTVQIYTFGDAIQRNLPLGVWVAHHHTLCVLLGAFTILFETFFFVSLFLPRYAPLFFAAGILFHIGLLVTSGHPFYQHILLNAMLMIFLDPNWFPARVHRLAVLLAPRWRRERAQQLS
jgi:hypothetical protein